MEQWKHVLNGKYEVSNTGKVRNSKTKKILSTDFPSFPYCKLNYRQDGKAKSKLVHRLVAKAFIPNPKNKSFINHLDGNKKNNNVSNLQWVTRQENEDHAFETGLKNSTGSANVQSKLTEKNVRYIKQSFNGNPKDAYRLANKFDVHRATIQRILIGDIWTHVLPNVTYNLEPNRKGSNNSQSKLDESDVYEIRYEHDDVSASVLSEKYNISKPQIYAIKRGDIWKHV